MRRAATLLLALLMPLAGVRATAATCCVDDGCDQPCCEHDTGNATVIPFLPCCRTVATDQASHPAPTTVESHQVPLLAPGLAPLAVAVAVGATPPPSSAHLPAPPLYQQHCALLL